jgi:hypothetical protein
MLPQLIIPEALKDFFELAGVYDEYSRQLSGDLKPRIAMVQNPNHEFRLNVFKS